MKGNGSGIGGRGLLIASVAFILIVGAIFFAISGGLFGGSKTNQADTQISVTDIFANRSVRMTVQGPIVANENRESYQIEVGLSARSIAAIKGFDSQVVSSANYDNNRQAYTEFAYALSRAGFGKARNVSDVAADERGVCATGKRYIFEILDNGRSVSRLWTSTCSNVSGTLDVGSKSISSIKSLFDLQIADRQIALKAIQLR